MTAHVQQHPIALDPLIAEAKQRTRRRRLIIAAAVAVVAACTAAGILTVRSTKTNVPSLAAGWQTTQTCTQIGGSLTPNLRWEARVATVSMSYATALGIDQQLPPAEFQRTGAHPPASAAQFIPCNVATMTANVAAAAWSQHAPRKFAIQAGTGGENAGPTYPFRCAVARGGTEPTGICVHRTDAGAGFVRVRFVIRRFHRPSATP